MILSRSIYSLVFSHNTWTTHGYHEALTHPLTQLASWLTHRYHM